MKATAWHTEQIERYVGELVHFDKQVQQSAKLAFSPVMYSRWNA